jgi:uncharacterized membrane protein
MTTQSRPARTSLRTARRIFTRTLLTVAGVIAGLFCLFLCGNMFAGYPRYHTALLTILAMILIALTGGAAWIIDERRIDADG